MKINKKTRAKIINIAIVLAGIVALGALYYSSLPKKAIENPAIETTRIEAREIKIYFLKGEKLEQVSRPSAEKSNILEVAARELMRGPNAAEKQAGIFSEIPAGTKIVKVSRDGETANITFNDEIENYGGGSARVQGLVAQIVYTFTEIPGITKVNVLVSKRKEVVLGGEGLVLDHPLSREELNAR